MYNPSNPKVVIFVVCYNRLEILTQTIESYKRFSTDYDLVIVNNGTDHPKCVALLDELSKEYKVFTGAKINTMDELTVNISNAVSDYYHKHETPYFAVSDCDCCFDIAPAHTLEVFIEMCNNLNKAISPHYIVSDIPANYPLRGRMIVAESRILYRKRMKHYRDDIYYSDDHVDTTFLLFKREPTFRRLQMDTCRVLMPYAARHLDWYIDVINPTEGNMIYWNKDSSVGSSGGSWLKGFANMFAKSKEDTFNFFLNSEKNPNDHCLNSFYLSWMYQYGHGTPVDLEKAKTWLINASPDIGSPEYNTRARSSDVIAMVINGDFSCLG